MKNVKLKSLISEEAEDKKLVALADLQVEKIISQYENFIKDNSVDKYKVEETVIDTPEVSALNDVPVSDFSTMAPMGDSFDSNPFAEPTSELETPTTNFEVENEANVEAVPSGFDNISLDTPEETPKTIVDNSFDLGNDAKGIDSFDSPVDDIQEISLKTPEHIMEEESSKSNVNYEQTQEDSHKNDAEPKYSFETLDVKSHLNDIGKYVSTIEDENERLTKENRSLQRANEKYLDENALLTAEREEATKAAASSEQARNIAERRLSMLERKYDDLEASYTAAKNSEAKAVEAQKIAEDELSVTKEENQVAKNALEEENKSLKIEVGELSSQLNKEKTRAEDAVKNAEEQFSLSKSESEIAKKALEEENNALKLQLSELTSQLNAEKTRAEDAEKAKEIAENQLSQAFERASEEIKDIKEHYETREPIVSDITPKIEESLPEQRVVDIEPVAIETQPEVELVSEPTSISEIVQEPVEQPITAIKMEEPVMEEPVKTEDVSTLRDVSLEAIAEKALDNMTPLNTGDTASGGVTNDGFQRIKAA